MKAMLLPLAGGAPILLSRDIIVVGRSRKCDLVLRDKSVSKLHGVLVKTDGLLMLRDLLSTNGCRVNGRRVTRAALLPNDLILFARQSFRVFLGPDDAPDPAPLQLSQKELEDLSSSEEDDAPSNSPTTIDPRRASRDEKSRWFDPKDA